MDFWLGAHRPSWLATAGVPLMVSDSTLAGRKTFPRAAAVWAQDSGGFTQVSRNGRYLSTPAEYAARTQRHMREVGLLAFAAPQDWVCEAPVLERTGLTVPEHQRRTIDNFLELRTLAPEVPWIPVLQGYVPDDYLRHSDAYERGGVSLIEAPLVGIGSVCRRQHTRESDGVIRRLTERGIRLHGFGFKLGGLRRIGYLLASADSMSWSYTARKNPRWKGCPVQHETCRNCLPYALAWRLRVLRAAEEPAQMELSLEGAEMKGGT